MYNYPLGGGHKIKKSGTVSKCYHKSFSYTFYNSNPVVARLASLFSASILPHTVPKILNLFPIIKLRGLVPNFYIHVPISDLYIPVPTTGPRQTDCGNIAHRYMNVEIGRQNTIILFRE
jgi:hypothetical protein